MHRNFNPEQVNWRELLLANNNNQWGGAAAGYTIFHGMPYQRGAGIGALFKSLMRHLIPLGKEIGAALGQQGLRSTSNVLTGVLEGKPLKSALKDEGRSGAQQLLQKASTRLAEHQQQGEGMRNKKCSVKRKPSTGKKQIGDGRKRKTINKKANLKKSSKRKLFSRIAPPLFPVRIKRKTTISKRKPNKKVRFDALGAY